MSTYLSAGIAVKEIDAGNYVTAAATNVAAYVGRATKGPIKQRVLVTNEKDYVNWFGEPTTETYEDFYTVAGYLTYGSAIYFDREVDASTALNSELNVTSAAATSGNGAYIQDWENYTPSFGGSDKLQITAKSPGAYGNTEFKVGIINHADWDNIAASPTLSGYSSIVEYGPTLDSEFLILVEVLQSDDTYALTEVHLVSDVETATDAQGNNIFVEQKINNGSNYIWAFNNSLITATPFSFAPTFLAGGADGTYLEADIATGYDLFANTEEIEINYLLGGAHTTIATALAIQAVADARKDCIALLDVPKSDVVNVSDIATAVSNVIDYRKNDLNINSSYGAMYANWLYVFDKYNNVNRWVPSTGHMAGILAYTANTSEAWYAPAGLNRGVLKNVIKLAINPNKSYRDLLYQAQLNPIVSFPGQGLIVWGQKTLLTKSSSFDRIQVRLLFNYIERAISKAAMYCVFEQNDSLLQAVFTNMTVPFLNDIKGRRGLYNFSVDCGPLVNTDEVINRLEFHAIISLEPIKGAEVIEMTFAANRRGGITVS